MPDPYADLTAGSLAASGQSAAIGPGRAVAITLYGTWVGTVVLQRKIGAAWYAIKEASWTANVSTNFFVGPKPELVRIDFTRSSGTVDYDLRVGPASV